MVKQRTKGMKGDKRKCLQGRGSGNGAQHVYIYTHVHDMIGHARAAWTRHKFQIRRPQRRAEKPWTSKTNAAVNKWNGRGEIGEAANKGNARGEVASRAGAAGMVRNMYTCRRMYMTGSPMLALHGPDMATATQSNVQILRPQRRTGKPWTSNQ